MPPNSPCAHPAFETLVTFGPAGVFFFARSAPRHALAPRHAAEEIRRRPNVVEIFAAVANGVKGQFRTSATTLRHPAKVETQGARGALGFPFTSMCGFNRPRGSTNVRCSNGTNPAADRWVEDYRRSCRTRAEDNTRSCGTPCKRGANDGSAVGPTPSRCLPEPECAVRRWVAPTVQPELNPQTSRRSMPRPRRSRARIRNRISSSWLVTALVWFVRGFV